MTVKARHPIAGGVPGTPRVISPSPTPSECAASVAASAAAAAITSASDGALSKDASYYAPITRSVARRRRETPQPVDDSIDEEDSDTTPDRRRSRTRSRSPIDSRKIKALTAVKSAKRRLSSANKKKSSVAAPNGHLAPPQTIAAIDTAKAGGTLGWSWHDLSRSPSPLGLIPIHRHWRAFVHKHEVPRKLLHVSIGFLSLWIYVSGTQTIAVCPYLLAALIPITIADYLRHTSKAFNQFYVKVLGALMRESEYSGWNGVIFYLLGALIALYCFPKDVGMLGILLLSWCDTAASTFGRAYGRYTPRIRRGKSLAGSFAAFVIGVATAAWFWGSFAPSHGPYPGDEEFPFMFTGTLGLPEVVSTTLGLGESQSTIGGNVALGVMSVVSGLIAAVSEVIDVFGWDDNLTIPVLSGIGIWGFLKVFG